MSEKWGFGGHESFPLRYGWLKKGYDLLADNPMGLSSDDAMVTLGVGKNMVGSIRHWGFACKVFMDSSTGRGVQPSAFGKRLLDSAGSDPYLEDIGSTWLLHWQLATNRARAGAWYWLFSRPRSNRFAKDKLVRELVELLDQIGTRVSESTIARDVDVLVRSYCRRIKSAGQSAEDLLESPFTTLGLLREASSSAEYELVQGVHPSLPVAVFEAALIEFAGVGDAIRRAVSLDELMYGDSSPGRVFRLSEEGLMARLHALQQQRPQTYVVDETAGLRQLLIRGQMPEIAEVLQGYYGTAAAGSSRET